MATTDNTSTTEPAAGADAIQSLGYEQARDELAGVVAALERGGATLDESIALWERGTALAGRCEEWLSGAKKKLDAAVAGTTAHEGDTDTKAGSGVGRD